MNFIFRFLDSYQKTWHSILISILWVAEQNSIVVQDYLTYLFKFMFFSEISILFGKLLYWTNTRCCSNEVRIVIGKRPRTTMIYRTLNFYQWRKKILIFNFFIYLYIKKKKFLNINYRVGFTPGNLYYKISFYLYNLHHSPLRKFTCIYIGIGVRNFKFLR